MNYNPVLAAATVASIGPGDDKDIDLLSGAKILYLNNLSNGTVTVFYEDPANIPGLLLAPFASMAIYLPDGIPLSKVVARFENPGSVTYMQLTSAIVSQGNSIAIPTQTTATVINTAVETATPSIRAYERINVIVAGTPDGVLTLQMLPDGADATSGWVDTGDTFSSEGVYAFPSATGALCRVIAKSGVASGSCTVWIRGV